MSEFWSIGETSLRLTVFGGGLLLLMAWEWWRPRRERRQARRRRWPTNLAMSVIDSLALRLLLPVAAVGAAAFAEQRDWGLFNQFTLPLAIPVVLTLLALDLLIYWQHRLLHALPWLWRLHRVHHSDLSIDVTTALRFHPLEILLSMLLKMAAVALLGAPPVAVLAFEILLNATAMFNHANLRLPAYSDRFLRQFIVTPDMHRVHHSWHQDETNSNFGFNLPWWDHLFGSYRAQPRDGHRAMSIGLKAFRDDKDQGLIALLAQPGRRDPSS